MVYFLSKGLFHTMLEVKIIEITNANSCTIMAARSYVYVFFFAFVTLHVLMPTVATCCLLLTSN